MMKQRVIVLEFKFQPDPASKGKLIAASIEMKTTLAKPIAKQTKLFVHDDGKSVYEGDPAQLKLAEAKNK